MNMVCRSFWSSSRAPQILAWSLPVENGICSVWDERNTGCAWVWQSSSEKPRTGKESSTCERTVSHDTHSKAWAIAACPPGEPEYCLCHLCAHRASLTSPIHTHTQAFLSQVAPGEWPASWKCQDHIPWKLQKEAQRYLISRRGRSGVQTGMGKLTHQPTQGLTATP